MKSDKKKDIKKDFECLGEQLEKWKKIVKFSAPVPTINNNSRNHWEVVRAVTALATYYSAMRKRARSPQEIRVDKQYKNLKSGVDTAFHKQSQNEQNKTISFVQMKVVTGQFEMSALYVLRPQWVNVTKKFRVAYNLLPETIREKYKISGRVNRSERIKLEDALLEMGGQNAMAILRELENVFPNKKIDVEDKSAPATEL